MSTKTHLALYRKYRPLKFTDVVGQEQAVNLLTSAIKQKKISHAYLFCGGRGTGKTTVARIVAREVGCDEIDIIEIDAASNRGIDEIRELREAVRTSPFSSPYKVYIVDEAHMLTKEAANALLKTLEEPPSHVIFILATTDPLRLPPTIVSRCQKVVFKQPDIKTLSDKLISVAKEEGFKLDVESAELIARHSHASYRDAIGILEQILTVSGKTISHADVIKNLGTPDKEILLSILEAICTKNEKRVLENIEKLKSKNISSILAYDEFLEVVREGLLARVSSKNDNNKQGGEIERLATEYPHTIGSKMLLALLEKRDLIEVSPSHGWTAFTAVLLSLVEG